MMEDKRKWESGGSGREMVWGDESGREMVWGDGR